MSNKALIIIDLQKGCKQQTIPYKIDEVVNNINKLSDGYRATGNTVIFIQHDGSNEGQYKPETEEWQLLDELEVKPNDLIISKTANDAFYKSSLEEELKRRNINELAICGWATDFCVNATVQSAYTKNYNITVVKDAHTVANREHITAETVIEYFNWLWQNMAPTNGTMAIKLTEELI